MMPKSMTLTVEVLDVNGWYTVVEVCERLHIPEALVEEMEAQGLIETVVREESAAPMLTAEAVRRMEVACRLHQDLGVNLAGVALALELLEELAEIRRRLALLER